MTAPRGWRLYFTRAVYVGSLFGLVVTAWLILLGSYTLEGPAALSRFGSAVFAVIAPVQLAMAIAFSALLTAAAVAQEKDRRTLELLLLSRLTNSELVLGKMLASMLTVLVLITAAAPLMVLLTLLGGVSHGQVLRVLGVTLAAAALAGSLGSMVALWREKTFQSLAATAIALVLWLLLGEAVANGLFGTLADLSPEDWAAGLSPFRAMGVANRAAGSGTAEFAAVGGPAGLFMVLASAAAIGLNLLAILRVRAWNPTRELLPSSTNGAESTQGEEVDIHAAPGPSRRVWDNPILWREVCTWAYGKKILFVRLGYLAVFAVCAIALFATDSTARRGGATPPEALPLVPLMVVSLVLVNALAVTSITNERDLKALDLLLVTDLSPKEIVYGKLGGIFFNSKEMLLLPLALAGFLWWQGALGNENLLFVSVGLIVVNAFVAMLGVHSGMTYLTSRSAVAVSLGTVLFLLLGVGVCMRMMVAFQGSFFNQLQAFLAFMLGGGAGLFVALGYRNASPAIGWATIPMPFASFFAITSFLNGGYGSAFLVAAGMYGFATAAMLVPAISEFDVATGRTSAQD
ncbi:MAG: ABC transporter permease [Planctomycetota bacterium]